MSQLVETFLAYASGSAQFQDDDVCFSELLASPARVPILKDVFAVPRRSRDRLLAFDL
jgi:hypothetical protein